MCPDRGDAVAHYGVSVSFSGGKDSTVLLDLARRAFPDIPAVFVDTGLEYPEIRDFVKSIPKVTWLRPEIPFPRVIETYGYPVISKEVAHRIYYARRGSTWAKLICAVWTAKEIQQNLISGF